MWEPRLERTEDPRDKYFLLQAYVAANECSDDPITKIGAVLVGQDSDGWKMRLRGANHVPHQLAEGTQQDIFQQAGDRTWKYQHMVHAEPAVLSSARSLGIETAGLTMYMPWVPCTPCAERIVEARIGRLVTHEALVQKTPERWWESTNAALEFLAKEGVRCETYIGKIGSVHSVFNGEVWWP